MQELEIQFVAVRDVSNPVIKKVVGGVDRQIHAVVPDVWHLKTKRGMSTGIVHYLFYTLGIFCSYFTRCRVRHTCLIFKKPHETERELIGSRNRKHAFQFYYSLLPYRPTFARSDHPFI